MFDAPRFQRRQRWIFGTIAVVTLGLIALSMIMRPGNLPPLPDPNGYDDLIAAGRAVTGDWTTLAPIELAPVEAVRPLVTANAGALDRIHLGLSRQSRVPLSNAPETLDRVMGDLGPLRQAGRLLAASSRLAAAEGRTADATSLALEVIQAGRSGTAGGLTVQAMAALAMESQGLSALKAIQDRLSAEDCRRLMRELARLDASREPLQAVFDRDLDYNLGSKSLITRAMMNLNWAVLKAQLQKANASARASELRIQTELRMLVLRLGARAFFLDQGRHPATIAEILPPELASVHLDPSSGTEFQIEPTPEGPPRFIRGIPPAMTGRPTE